MYDITWGHSVVSLLGKENLQINILKLRLNGHHCADVSICNFLNGNRWNFTEFIPKDPINIPALVKIMAWCRQGDKPLSEPMMSFIADAYMHDSASMSWIVLERGWNEQTEYLSLNWITDNVQLWMKLILLNIYIYIYVCVSVNWIIIGSSNDLFLLITKLLHKPMLT